MNRERGISPLMVLVLSAAVGLIAIEIGIPRGSLATMNKPRHQRQIMVHLFGVLVLYVLIRARSGIGEHAGAPDDGARRAQQGLARLVTGETSGGGSIGDDIEKLRSWLRESEAPDPAEGSAAGRPGGLAELMSLVEGIRVRALGTEVKVANGQFDLVAEPIKGIQEAAAEAGEWLAELEKSLAAGPVEKARKPALSDESRALLTRLLEHCEKSSTREAQLRQLHQELTRELPPEGASR